MNSEELLQHFFLLRHKYGPPMEKTAEVQYLYNLDREEWEDEALTPQFTKLAYGMGKNPWILAHEVAEHFDGIQKLAGENELAEFYVSWAEEIEKRAGLALIKSLGIGRGLKAGAKMLKKRVGTAAQRMGMKPGVAKGTSQWQLGGAPKVTQGKSRWKPSKTPGKMEVDPKNLALGAAGVGALGLGGYALAGQPSPQPGYGY